MPGLGLRTLRAQLPAGAAAAGARRAGGADLERRRVRRAPRINWDAHEDVVENHNTQAIVMDQPVAGLLKDLKARGMLEDTLVVWSTEFGRTPVTQGLGTLGRDHHQHAFTCWLAGAGVKKGFGFRKSDEVGYYVAENKVTIYDFHATIVHPLGLDHERLTFYHNGINRRLTDVHGHVVKELLA